MQTVILKNEHKENSRDEKYSAIVHLAHICWLSRWKDGLFGMLTACFDASGHPTQPVLVVAGFIAPAPEWEHFEREWKDRLAIDGITSFHMQEFAQSSGVFCHRQ
jgi:hypothetical protein